MRDDLVKRHVEQLRLTGGDLGDLCQPLADAIEALTAERDHAWSMVAKADTQVVQSLADRLQDKAQIDRLRAALEDIADHDTGATAGLAYTAKIALKGETP